MKNFKKPERIKKRTFIVPLEVKIEVSSDLLEQISTDAQWQDLFYPLRSPEAVAQHLAFNLVQGRSIHLLDGFADRRSTDAEILGIDFCTSIDTEEIKK